MTSFRPRVGEILTWRSPQAIRPTGVSRDWAAKAMPAAIRTAQAYLLSRSELTHIDADVSSNIERNLPGFLVFLDVVLAGASRNSPVDQLHAVAREVGTGLRILQPGPVVDRVVRPEIEAVGQLFHRQLKLT